MKFDQNKFDGSCKLIFDEEEIKHLRKNQYIEFINQIKFYLIIYTIY